MLRRKRVLAAKIETTVGVPEALTGTDAGFYTFDATIQPAVEAQEREGPGAFSRLTSSLGPTSGTATFTMEVIPGSGAVPPWARTFLPACGLVAGVGGLEYSPRTEAPGANVKTLTIGMFEDGVYKRLSGCCGNAVFRFTSGQRVLVEFTFTGVWNPVSDTALITPVCDTTKPLKFVNAGFKLGGFSPVVQELTIDLGNEVVLREDANSANGYISAMISDRRVNGTFNPEMTRVATKAWHANWSSELEEAMEVALLRDDLSVEFDMPKVQVLNLQEADRSGIAIENVEYQANRSTCAGDDELTITFDTTGD